MEFCKVFVIIILIHQEWAKETNENKTFVATKEWQEIPEGQGIPAGLHIRINLETGKKEAKILDEADDSKEDHLEHIDKNNNAALTVINEGSRDKGVGKKTKKIKHLDEALQRIGIDYTPKEKVDNIIRKYRSYEELKKNFEGIWKAFKTDSEIIVQLIEEFHNSSTTTNNKDVNARIKTQIQILESLNYLMSQFDNALQFVNQGGLDQVLLPILVNQTHTGLKVEAMRVLGAMAQNNPRVQVKVFERNVGSHLAQIIMSSTKTDELSAALYAFSSLLRKFPHAQQKILSTSGTQALVSVLSRDCELKIKAKAAIIIGDLIEERELVLSKSSVSDDPLAAAQYADISFHYWLIDHDYCDIMENLIKTHAPIFLEAPDILEYFVYALNNSRSFCLNWQQNSILMEIFISLKKHYAQSKDEYHQDVTQLVADFLEKLYGDVYTKHDEL